MLTTLPIRSTSTWTSHAKNAEVVLHRDAYKKSHNGTIPASSDGLLLAPELTDDVISEITKRIIDGSHFTFIKPGESIKEAYPKESLAKHILWARAIRALQLSTMEKLGNAIEKDHTEFMGNEEGLKYRTGLITFNPKNPIKPHSDFLEGNAISATTCTQKLSSGESLSKTTIWNIDPEQTTLSQKDFTHDTVQGIYYIKKDLINDGSVESYELPQFEWNEGAIVFYSDRLVAHSATEQISHDPRRIHVMDLTPFPSRLTEKDYSQSLRAAKISFQDGQDIEF